MQSKRIICRRGMNDQFFCLSGYRDTVPHENNVSCPSFTPTILFTFLDCDLVFLPNLFWYEPHSWVWYSSQVHTLICWLIIALSLFPITILQRACPVLLRSIGHQLSPSTAFVLFCTSLSNWYQLLVLETWSLHWGNISLCLGKIPLTHPFEDSRSKLVW